MMLKSAKAKKIASTETIGGVTHHTLEAQLASDRLKLRGVVPDGLTMSKSGLLATFTVILPQDQTKPIVGVTTEMTVTYTGTGAQSSIPITADHTAHIHESWTRTPLP